MEFEFRKAIETDLQFVSDLYSEAVGREGCAWDEEYPGKFWLNRDFETGNLYVMTNEENRPVGAVSVVYENELDALADWSETQNVREIARVVVCRALSGQGLAQKMLRRLFEILAGEGVLAVHLSVADSNPAAVNTYRKLGFGFIGECDLYGHHFYLCEKRLQITKGHSFGSN